VLASSIAFLVLGLGHASTSIIRALNVVALQPQLLQTFIIEENFLFFNVNFYIYSNKPKIKAFIIPQELRQVMIWPFAEQIGGRSLQPGKEGEI
jgi:hypothetical protein